MNSPLTDIDCKIISDFHEKGFKDTWQGILNNSNSYSIFQSWEYLNAWWQVFGRGKLLITVNYESGTAKGIIPLFEDGSMLYLIGSGGSDYLDIIGVLNSEQITIALQLAASYVKDYKGCIFYHIREDSICTQLLKEVAEKTGWKIYCENEQKSPFIKIDSNPDYIKSCINKKSLKRHANWFNSNGALEIIHLKNKVQIEPLMIRFFNQHITRWAHTSYPSLFIDPKQKSFYLLLLDYLKEEWIIFTCIRWNNIDIAYHFGFEYNSTFLWYKPSFDIDFAQHSPGEVLLRELLIRAEQEKINIFDFGLGDENFKARFATSKLNVYDWGLYP